MSLTGFNVVLIIPTGIGCELGGHAGDANPLAKLIGSCCDHVFLHPNVVNASDINEMPENAFYVEGSILDRFLWGDLYLKPPMSYNRILLVSNKPVPNEIINAAGAARVTLGAQIELVALETPLKMKATFKPDGRADGDITGIGDLVEQVNKYDFDALAVSSPVEVSKRVALRYLKHGGVNPWGGVEAKASRMIANALDKPVAHAPQSDSLQGYNEVVDPRAAPELVSMAYIHSVLKGLHRAPRVDSDGGMSVEDISCLVSPWCWGPPHEACAYSGIPIIIVKENRTIYSDRPASAEWAKEKGVVIVENYWEAVGVMQSIKAGIDSRTVRRPLCLK